MEGTMSVLGLYNYDDTIFDNMQFPELMSATEKQDTINNIILECAELEVLYTNPSFMKFAIQTWSRKELPSWERVYTASVAEYDPIENYNRYEESTQTTDMTRQHSGNDTRRMVIDQTEANRGIDTVANSGTDTTAHSGKDTTQLSGSDGSHTVIDADEVHTGTDTTTNTGSDVTTNQIAGFDSNTLVDHDKSTLAHGHGTSLLHGESVATDTTEDITITHGKKEELTHGHTEQLTHGHTETTTHGHAIDTDADNTETTTHGLKIEDDGDVTTESHIHGNIGVTTSQMMLESELNLIPKLNVINYITESFKKRFCLLVY